MNRIRRIITYSLVLLTISTTTALAQAQHLSSRYSKSPLVIACDWDKPPYEFLDDYGMPAGSNVDILKTILERLDIPYQFVMKEWSHSIKTFERGDADLILANVNRFKGSKYHATQIINYNRIKVAMTTDTMATISINTLEKEGMVLKTGDYTGMYFKDADSVLMSKIEYQSPKAALRGLLAGDCKYFVWGEEPLKWKLKELNLEGIYLNEVGIPVSEVHLIGRDKELIDLIDDQFSRMKQSGELEQILNRWLHPERVESSAPLIALYIIVGFVALAMLILVFHRLTRRQVQKATRNSTELKDMMFRALHMGNLMLMRYDIANDRMTNQYGCTLLPKQGLTLEEFADHIHPDQRQEFMKKMETLIAGRGRKFELDKRWNMGTDKKPNWLTLNGYAICEVGDNGKPAYIVNAIHDATQDVEENKAERELVNKYDRLANIPLASISFYDKDGWLISSNDSMKELCGMNESAETKRFWETVCMFDVPTFRNVFSKEDMDDLLVCQHMLYPEMGLDKYIEFHVSPLFSAEGIVNYLVAATDRTSERNLDHELHRQEHEANMMKQQTEEFKQQLGFLLENTGRTLQEDEQTGQLRVVVDTRQLEDTRQQLDEQTKLASESVKLKSAFLASMTHELRTPLNAIVGFTGILSQLGSEEERMEYVRIIRNSSDMLQRLINDVIEASSLTDGSVIIRPEETDFAADFDDICQTLQQRIQNTEVTFIKDNPYDTFITTVDIERIQQVLTNFVTNAVKFTKQGHIRVGYRYERSGLYLYCEDTGIGIPPSEHQHIFERFVKLDEFVQGTGLGLTICKSIAERCHGEIGVDSKGEGQGATFWLWIPCERKISNVSI